MRRRRIHDAERTRRSILNAARATFADKGFDGANGNEIVARPGTTKPMIYDHFGSKEGLFASVLEEVYAGMRAIEGSLDLSALRSGGSAAVKEQVSFYFGIIRAHMTSNRLASARNSGLHPLPMLTSWIGPVGANNSLIVERSGNEPLRSSARMAATSVKASV